MGYIAFQKGGYRHAGFTRKDLYNHVDRYRRSKVKNEDANAAINYLIGKSNNDPLFFGKYTFTSDERLEHIFWADGQSIINYHCFGDIVAFDSTSKKNKYNKPFVIFSGCNHHGQTVIFGSGLLSDETTETYKWLLETFVEAMGGKSPKAVITDGDLAMRDAIKNVLLDATHRLCGWHLQRNACENIKNPNFLRNFKCLIYDNNDHREFDWRWAAILDKHNLVGSTWMEKTYETHAMWSHCFLRDKFFGYIRTTSQCEGINSLIRFYVNRKNTLIDFMHNLDRALKEYRNNELIAGFKSQFSEPVMITLLEVYERSASCYFTRNIFKEIRNEIQRAGALNIKVLSTTLDKVEFSVTALRDPAKDRRVEVDRDGNASSKDSGFSAERFANCSRSISVKSEHHSGPKTKPFKKGGTRKFTATGMRNRKGKDNTFDEVKESQQDKRHSFTNYECVNDVIDDKCDTPHVQIDLIVVDFWVTSCYHCDYAIQLMN
ncbi:protein FAR1-RELATED SEQUENCE 5-like [Arachis hypogaea]|uniref:protein FAR1-RELATED SEQUENCE 5-like n=1 Tax=Arachis hypogaea TaxID=3818 RepID=UPI000DECC057|nr:protein FAR1-RELATED SEQUENCE 5-like [Arachis hypogaea]